MAQWASPSSAVGAASAEVVGGLDQLEHAGGVGDRAVDVAGEQGQRGPVHRELGGDPVELVVVEDDRRRRRRVLERRLHELEQRLDPGGVAGGHPGAHQGDGEHGPVAEDLVGQGFEPATERRLLAAPAHQGGGQLDELRGSFDVVRRPWRGRSPRPGRRSASYQSLARRWSSGTRSGSSSSRRARSTSAKRWW